jgi:hypothetical protein
MSTSDVHLAGSRDARPCRPLILIPGFGGLSVTDDRQDAYEGFNGGSVYPDRRGDGYIYEGFLLRALKSDHYRYRDATNVVGYYAEALEVADEAACDGWRRDAVCGTVVIHPGTARRVLGDDVRGTIWVYRYYDLMPRGMAIYGAGLVRLIRLIEAAAGRYGQAFDGVDIVAHSMGGLVVRQALRQLDAERDGTARSAVNRVVTLGTPHRGISFQHLPQWLLDRIPVVSGAADEIAAFDRNTRDFLEVDRHFDIDRLLTVVGTNRAAYGNVVARLLNRLSSVADSGRLDVDRSDGLVTQASAQLPGAARTFVHKCHVGPDSLVTSREAYEIAMRFFHASHRIRLWLDAARVKRGHDVFGRSEFHFGVSVRPRYVDFDLFHQSAGAENLYGPFRTSDLSDPLPELAAELRKPLAEEGDHTTGWAGPDRLIWQGWVDEGAKLSDAARGVVFRLDIHLIERDSFGIGFSDNVVFHKQYYVQAFPGEQLALFVHTGEDYLSDRAPRSREELEQMAVAGFAAPVQPVRPAPEGKTGGTFEVGGTGFEAILRLEVLPEAH